MGEPQGVPTATGANFLREPWNRSRHFRLERKLPTQAMTYLCTPTRERNFFFFCLSHVFVCLKVQRTRMQP